MAKIKVLSNPDFKPVEFDGFRLTLGIERGLSI